MATTVKADAKAGFCQWCRQGDHGVCASATCKCTQVVHRNRPGFGRAATGGQSAAVRRNGGGSGSAHTAQRTAHAVAPAAAKPAKAKVEAVWALVKEEPAAPLTKPKKLKPAEQAKPLLDAIVEAEDTDSHRIALFGTPIAASRIRNTLATEYSEGWEWKAGRDSEGRAAVFVRWLGAGAEA